MSICLIDTSVFCNIIRVPNLDQDHLAIGKVLEGHVGSGVTLLLPMATILETGNHVARNGDGRQRRQTARRFVKAVVDAIDGEAPWTPTPFFEAEALRGWLGQFPNHAAEGRGLGDLSIIKEYERQCTLHRQREVFIWSLDDHLASYRRPAREWGEQG